jgi:hypothetical protein
MVWCESEKKAAAVSSPRRRQSAAFRISTPWPWRAAASSRNLPCLRSNWQPHSGDIVEGAVLGRGCDLSAAAHYKLVCRMGHLRIIRGPEA